MTIASLGVCYQCTQGFLSWQNNQRAKRNVVQQGTFGKYQLPIVQLLPHQQRSGSVALAQGIGRIET